MNSVKYFCVCLYLTHWFGSTKAGLFRALFPRVYDTTQDMACSPPLGDTCIEIRKCKFFSDLLDKTPIPRPQSIVKIIRDHQCGWERVYGQMKPKVCCFSRPATTTTTTTTTSTTTTTTQGPPKRQVQQESLFHTYNENYYNHPNFNLLPLDQCGPINPVQSRVTEGKNVGLEEFPWMALIVYNTPDVGIEFRCGGTLINERYVLTAAHCILNLTVIGVRLGEYDLSNNRKPDCEGSYCSPPTQDFYFDKIIVHPKYNPKSFENDIALIRLRSPANFTSNVRPICLPVSETNDDLTGRHAVISGWGVTEKGFKSPVLLKTTVPVRPLKYCQKIYSSFSASVPLSANQICAGGSNGQDSCSGDSGGPLKYVGMIDGSPRFIQYGIVSYGPKECGTLPGIYTRIANYIFWILDTIGPDNT